MVRNNRALCVKIGLSPRHKVPRKARVGRTPPLIATARKPKRLKTKMRIAPVLLLAAFITCCQARIDKNYEKLEDEKVFQRLIQ